MSDEIDVIWGRLDEHGRILTEHGREIEGLALVVMGDTEMQVKGLLQRTNDLEMLVMEVREWRNTIGVYWKVAVFYIRIIIGLLGLLGLAAWQPALQSVFGILSGG